MASANLAEGEELGSNLLQVPYRSPTGSGGPRSCCHKGAAAVYRCTVRDPTDRLGSAECRNVAIACPENLNTRHSNNGCHLRNHPSEVLCLLSQKQVPPIRH